MITFIKRIENLDYIDAVKLLASRAGLEMPTDTQSKGLSELRKRIFEANREAARFFIRLCIRKTVYTHFRICVAELYPRQQ